MPIFQLEEMIALAERVKEWDFQIREKHRVSARGEDFRETTKTSYRNTYCGKVPSTGHPAVEIRITHVEGEYFDFGSHFSEDTRLEISANVDDNEMGYAMTTEKVDRKLGPEYLHHVAVLGKIFHDAQKNYHAKFRGDEERQEARDEHNLKCAYNRARKILDGEKK